jgi:hypothetical protein
MYAVSDGCFILPFRHGQTAKRHTSVVQAMRPVNIDEFARRQIGGQRFLGHVIDLAPSLRADRSQLSTEKIH